MMKKNARIASFMIGLIGLGAIANSAVADDEATTVKVGVLKFGTVNWLLNTVQHHGLDKKHGVNLEVTGLGGKNASSVALQGGAVDMIVSDWLWVSRQRSEDKLYTLSPYSNAVGSLMVSKESGIKTLADIDGKKIGVAGGPVDKTWLLLRAYSQKELDKDLKDVVEPQFGAPPLLNKLASKGDLDGVINFWHFAAKLKAGGMEPLISVPEVLKSLGVDKTIPLIGWVFSDDWAKANEKAAKGFLKATHEAQALLLSSDEEWDRLRPKMKAKDDSVFNELRDAFRKGIPTCFGDAEKEASKQVFDILAKLGGEKLVGKATSFAEGTFWAGTDLPECVASH